MKKKNCKVFRLPLSLPKYVTFRWVEVSGIKEDWVYLVLAPGMWCESCVYL